MCPAERKSRLVCVTQRLNCRGDFLERLKQILSCSPSRLILREKDMELEAYLELASVVQPLCGDWGVPLTLSALPQKAWDCPAFLDFLRSYGCGIQLPFALAGEGENKDLKFGLSVHSAEEARQAADSSAGYLVAGHVYPTSCKPGLAPRGLGFLKEVVMAAPEKQVYAIGGVTPERVPEVLKAGAAGYCVMGPLMACFDPLALMKAYVQQEQAE